jgi:hypothetical protein
MLSTFHNACVTCRNCAECLFCLFIKPYSLLSSKYLSFRANNLDTKFVKGFHILQLNTNSIVCCVYMYMFVCVYMCVRTCVCVCVCVCVRTRKYMCVCVCA